MITKLKEIENLIDTQNVRKLAVVAAHDDNVLGAVKEVYDKGYVEPILIGDKEKIFEIAEAINLDISRMNIVKEMNDIQSANLAVNMINSGEAHALMKGAIQTADMMRVAFDKEKGLRTGKLISNVVVIENPNYHKLLFITDPAITIAPDLSQKAEIIKNAVQLMHKLKNENPKVAVLSAIETVNTSMQCTLDAASLTMMNRRGQIKDCIIDGPLSMDLAISMDSVQHKNVKSKVAGDADLLVAPDIQAANILVKSLSILNGNTACTVMIGTKAPMVITSRADTRESKYYSILMALAV
ncbi:MAG: phosphate butyryltransferase [Eubacterium sp.]|nr:phosphate butyryltransferase [Eubacterium sp.]